MVVLNKFMCCCQLRTGAVVIGWVGLILEVISLTADSAFLANLQNIYIGVEAAAVKIPLSISLACTVLSVIAQILLLWGANTKNRLFLLPWLIITMIFIVGTFLTTLIIGIVLAANTVDAGVVAGVFLIGFLFTSIVMYLWVCVLSLFQEFRDDPLNNDTALQYQKFCGDPLSNNKALQYQNFCDDSLSNNKAFKFQNV